MEEVVTLVEIYNAVQSVYELVDGSEDTEIYELLRQSIEMSSNGEADSDTELILKDIYDSLQYNEQYTSLQEISARLEVIDTRLDKEFIAINDCLSVIASVVLAWFSIRFLSWIFRPFCV